MPKALLSFLTVIVTCALPGAAALAAPATPTFGPKTAFDANTSGGLPKSVTKANFNNDSYDDAAITSSFVYRDSPTEACRRASARTSTSAGRRV